MASFVTIANRAASSLGEDDQLRSPDDDTHLSRSVRAVWDDARREAIRDHTWNFATRRASLAQVPDQDTAPYAFAYRLPADNLRLVEVLGFKKGQYQLEGPFILSNAAAPLRIRYLIDVPEPAEWDASFVTVFAMCVAWQIADRITGDATRVQLAEKKYLRALSQAKRVDARENPQVPSEPTEWELARGRSDCRVDSNGLVWP